MARTGSSAGAFVVVGLAWSDAVLVSRREGRVVGVFNREGTTPATTYYRSTLALIPPQRLREAARKLLSGEEVTSTDGELEITGTSPEQGQLSVELVEVDDSWVVMVTVRFQSEANGVSEIDRARVVVDESTQRWRLDDCHVTLDFKRQTT